MAEPPPYSSVAPPQDPYKQEQQLPPVAPAYGWQYPSSQPTNYDGAYGGSSAYRGDEAYKNERVNNDDVEGQGGSHYNNVGFAASGFSDINIRAGFVRKVYFTLTTQLLITFGIVALFVFCDPVKDFIQEYYWLYYIGYAVFLLTYFMLICCEGMRRKFPTNIGLLLIFTLAFSYMVATISSYYDTDIIFMALGITCAVTLSVSLFACQTKIDFTKWIGVAVVLSFCLFFFGIFCIFFYSNILHLVYGLLGAILFTIFLAIDTQMIVGGKRHEISPEDHILGAIMLYIDIVYIFLFILQIFGRGGD